MCMRRGMKKYSALIPEVRELCAKMTCKEARHEFTHAHGGQRGSHFPHAGRHDIALHR